MNISKIAGLMGAVGIFIIISSTVRWFWLYPDPSQLILADSIGAIVCGFAYLYDWMKKKDEYLSKLERRMDAIAEWYTGNIELKS